MSKIFYLKVNRDENYTYRNLQHWIDIVSEIPEGVAYIICDNETVRKKIFEKINCINTKVYIIESNRINSELEFLLLNICISGWKKPGLAHLTTFLHAEENSFQEFWNIDADDTYICLSKERCAEVLYTAQEYAKDNGIDLFSLDMWYTRHYEVGPEAEWSFGITYVNNKVQWLEFMKQHCVDTEYKLTKYANLDQYFIYLRSLNEYRIEAFYFENMRFLHYSDDFFRRIVRSGFYHWKNNYLNFPLLEACLGLEKLSKIRIPNDVIKLDICISDEEVKNQFLDSILDKDLFDVLEERADSYLEKNNE